LDRPGLLAEKLRGARDGEGLARRNPACNNKEEETAA
jgi:hypothetical protein